MRWTFSDDGFEAAEEGTLREGEGEVKRSGWNAFERCSEAGGEDMSGSFKVNG